MQLLRRGHQFEYRDHQGVDRLGLVDVWTSGGGARAVLVLRDLPHADTEAQARRALLALTHTCLPYLLRPDVRLNVLVLRPRLDETAKARALVLPLSA
ncbi:hypothetical protein [Deinococcus aluminii]|uniref:Uncharacterized protein n=1 Tax=Deinococcus aluminii TaxID=1656885 RepID=A0ABP9XBK7_9DEIO